MMTVEPEGKRRIASLSVRGTQSLQVESDMWFEILSRLPTKSLFVSKCVCKPWRDFASSILVHQRKMPFLPTHGVFFEIRRYSRDDVGVYTHNFDSQIIYIPLTYVNQSVRIEASGNNTVNYGYSKQLLGDLSLDLNPLYAKPSLIAKLGMFYTGHNGLILTVHAHGTYRVINPATNEVLELPKPPNNADIFYENRGKWIWNNAIINLSCAFSCSFFVMRFLKPHKLVDIYNPKTRTWVRHRFSLADRTIKEMWCLSSYAFLNRTLYFLTSGGQVVAMEFGSLDEPKICSTYAFGLPDVVRDRFMMATIGECQGCLYLSYVDFREGRDGFWIWKYDGVSSANPWIPVFELSKRALLSKPVTGNGLVRIYNRGFHIVPMGFHPEAEVVFIYAASCYLFAYDMQDGFLQQIGALGRGEGLKREFFLPYKPCLASLGPFMR